MGVKSGKAVAVVDFDIFTPARVVSNLGDRSGLPGVDGGAVRCAYVYALMASSVSEIGRDVNSAYIVQRPAEGGTAEVLGNGSGI